MSKQKRINLYIVDNGQTFIDKLEEIFFENRELGINVIGSARKYAECEADQQHVKATDVFLISAFLPDKMGTDLITYLKRNVKPNAKYIVTVNSNTRNLVDKAVEAGADNFLQKPFEPKKLVEMIYDFYGQTLEEVEEEEEDVKTPPRRYEEDDEDEEEEVFEIEDEDEEEEVEEKPKDDFKRDTSKKDRELVDLFGGYNPGRNIFQSATSNGDKPSKVVVFTAPKSVGKTSILVNVAAAVRKNSEYDPKIVILDLDLVYPSIALKFHQDDLKFSKKNIYDLLDDMGHLNEDLLSKALIEHEPTKIQIVDTPFESIRDFGKVTGEKVRQLILYLRENFDLVLVDTSGNIRDDSTIVPLTLGDTNVVLFQSDLSSLLHTRKFVEMIQLVERRTERDIIDKSIFVLNRFNESENLSIDLVKSSIFNTEGLDLNIPLYIPEEQLMTKYGNNGQFIINKQGETGEKITELASMVYPFYSDNENHKAKKQEKKSLFDLLKSKLKK